MLSGAGEAAWHADCGADCEHLRVFDAVAVFARSAGFEPVVSGICGRVVGLAFGAYFLK